MTTTRPSGRVEVMAAILEAAADLFAERGPAATSIREVAARSGVNHGLVYRHFGTKEVLVAAVLDHAGDEVSRELATGGPRLAAAADRQLRVLARAILDGQPVGRLQHRFPTVAGVVDRARARTDDQVTARLAAGHVVALELGWRLFEPFIRAATGLDDVAPTTVRATTHQVAAAVLADPDRWRPDTGDAAGSP